MRRRFIIAVNCVEIFQLSQRKRSVQRSVLANFDLVIGTQAIVKGRWPIDWLEGKAQASSDHNAESVPA